MDVFALPILTLLWTLALITFCEILFALAVRSLIFITRKNISQATFILGCNMMTWNLVIWNLVTWNLEVFAMLAKGWGWKIYWPFFSLTCGVTFCIIYAISVYNPPQPVSNTREFDHVNSHKLIAEIFSYVKGLFDYVNPRCSNVAPSHLKDLSPAQVETPKKIWWSAIWLALIRPENIPYMILHISMCLLHETVVFFDMVTMNSGWRRVWSSFVTTGYIMSVMIFVMEGMIFVLYVEILIDNSVVLKRLFNFINISPRRAESDEDANVVSSHLTGLSPAAIESPIKFWSALLLWENIVYMIFMVSLSLLSWSVTIIAVMTTNSGWEMAWSSFAVTFGVIFMIYMQGLFDQPSRRPSTENVNVMAPSKLTDLSPAAVESPVRVIFMIYMEDLFDQTSLTFTENVNAMAPSQLTVESPIVIPDINSEKGEGKATKQEVAVVYTLEK